jgi:hypothetical protein
MLPFVAKTRWELEKAKRKRKSKNNYKKKNTKGKAPVKVLFLVSSSIKISTYP